MPKNPKRSKSGRFSNCESINHIVSDSESNIYFNNFFSLEICAVSNG